VEEAEVLINRPIRDLDGMREAAVRIKGMGPRQVLITGGHLPGSPVDLYYDGRDFREYTGERIDTAHTHGSGCTLASAVTAGLAKGLTLQDAIRQARAYVHGAIRHGLPLARATGRCIISMSCIGWRGGIGVSCSGLRFRAGIACASAEIHPGGRPSRVRRAAICSRPYGS